MEEGRRKPPDGEERDPPLHFAAGQRSIAQGPVGGILGGHLWMETLRMTRWNQTELGRMPGESNRAGWFFRACFQGPLQKGISIQISCQVPKHWFISFPFYSARSSESLLAFTASVDTLKTQPREGDR